MRKVKAILFDMDGVLVDSEPTYLDFFTEFFRRNGKKADRETLLKLVGASNKETWRIIAQMWSEDCDPEWLHRYYKESCADLKMPYREKAFPGMRETLRALHERGIELYIASASSLPSIQRMVAETEIGAYLSGFVSGETVKRSKPAPDVYLQAIALSGYTAEACMAVEDSGYGMQAAKAANLFVAGVYSALEPTAWEQADIGIRSITELLELVEG